MKFPIGVQYANDYEGFDDKSDEPAFHPRILAVFTTFDNPKKSVGTVMHFISILRHSYWDSTRPIRILTILMYPLAMMGLYWAWQSGSSDMYWMFHLTDAPEYCHALFWGLVVCYIWIARIVGVLIFEGWKWTLRTTPMLGICFWSMLLASNIHDSDTLTFGTLYGVCALLETWLLSRNWLETA